MQSLGDRHYNINRKLIIIKNMFENCEAKLINRN